VGVGVFISVIAVVSQIALFTRLFCFPLCTCLKIDIDMQSGRRSIVGITFEAASLPTISILHSKLCCRTVCRRSQVRLLMLLIPKKADSLAKKRTSWSSSKCAASEKVHLQMEGIKLSGKRLPSNAQTLYYMVVLNTTPLCAQLQAHKTHPN